LMALRAAVDADRDRILVWRNHPKVRQASLTTHVIGADEHAKWWRAVRADPRRHLLLYQHAGVDAGVVTVSVGEDQAATWSFYLDVAGLDARGALMPAWIALERETVAYAFDELGVHRLGGEVLAWNTAGLALHERLGFRATQRYETEVDGVKQDVIWIELEAAAHAR
jgi:UDP-4-amino-4,6-dideoxy-N-acetyl-beta-L-altrosamine N-acetyltransferase